MPPRGLGLPPLSDPAAEPETVPDWVLPPGVGHPRRGVDFVEALDPEEVAMFVAPLRRHQERIRQRPKLPDVARLAAVDAVEWCIRRVARSLVQLHDHIDHDVDEPSQWQESTQR